MGKRQQTILIDSIMHSVRVKKGDKIVIITDPPFVHPYGHDNDCKNNLCHEYRGSFNRHRAVERVLVFPRQRILLEIIGDAFPLYELLHSFIGIFFGLNCNFPRKDVALYTVWYLKGCKPESVKEEQI